MVFKETTAKNNFDVWILFNCEQNSLFALLIMEVELNLFMSEKH